MSPLPHLLLLALIAKLCSSVDTDFAVHANPETEIQAAHNKSSPIAGHLWNVSDAGTQDGRSAGKQMERSTIREQWHDLQLLSAQLAVRTVFENIQPTIDQLFDQNNVSIRCQSSVYKVLADAALLKKYAVQLLDSCGKFPPSGMLEGTLTDLGRFDECLDIDQMLEGEDSLVATRMQGQYCSVIVRPPLPPRPRFHTFGNQIPSLRTFASSDSVFRLLGENAQYFYYTPLRIGICTPSQCSVSDVQAVVSKLASRFNMTAEILNMKCSKQSPATVNYTQLACMMAFVIVLLLVLLGSWIDVHHGGKGDANSCPKTILSPEFFPRPVSAVNALKHASVIVAAPYSGRFWTKSGSVPLESETTDSQHCFSDCSQWVRALSCFSVKRNGAAILNLDEGMTSDSLSIIHGLRVLTMAWIILGHTYGLVNPQIHSRVFSATDLYASFIFQGLLNATLSVDTFFFISGLLTVYTLWRRVDMGDSGEKSVPWLKMTCLRYFRLTPAYAAVIALALVFPLFSSGPLWRETVDAVAQPCYQSWWTNLLYINNFVKTDKLCLMHSWYLSNDMQMHVFAILFILLLMRSKVLAFLLLVLTVIACTAASAIQIFVNEYPPTIVSTSPVVEYVIGIVMFPILPSDRQTSARSGLTSCNTFLSFLVLCFLSLCSLITGCRDRWQFILAHYYKPWPHLPSYCIGLALGYALASKCRLSLSQAQARTSWFFISLSCFVALYGVYPWNMGWHMGPEVTALYAATFRTIWTACCAWTTFALLTRNSNGIMARMLSWKGFLPFSRLTYMAFLVHPFVIWYHSASARERFTPTHFNYFHLFLGHYLLTYVVAFAFGLCFESPFLALQKLLWSKGAGEKDKKADSLPPARQPVTLISSGLLSSDLPALIAVRDKDQTQTPSEQADSRHADGAETQIMGKKESSFVHHIRNNCGSESTVVYVNTV